MSKLLESRVSIRKFTLNSYYRFSHKPASSTDRKKDSSRLYRFRRRCSTENVYCCN